MSLEFNVCDTYHQFELFSGYYGKVDDILEEINQVTSSERQDGDAIWCLKNIDRDKISLNGKLHRKGARSGEIYILCCGCVEQR
jgi:hypothetical protein